MIKQSSTLNYTRFKNPSVPKIKTYDYLKIQVYQMTQKIILINLKE